MKIFLKELSDFETELTFTQQDPWVFEAVARFDEKFDEKLETQFNFKSNAEATPSTDAALRPIEAYFSLRKVDDVVVISGHADATIHLVCSRCVAPFGFHTHPKFSALFCKDPVMAGVAHLQQLKGEDEKKPAGQNKGFARHAHDENYESDLANGKDIDITYISEEFINLADVLSEQIQMQLPFQPLCKEDCKGMCAQCGADLNIGRCACAKIMSSHPFSALKDLKLNRL